MPDGPRAGNDVTAQESIWPLVRTFLALKINKVWPRAAVIVLLGWTQGQRRWRVRQHCTGLTARWCPLHGHCICDDPSKALDDLLCPLHAGGSDHAG